MEYRIENGKVVITVNAEEVEAIITGLDVATMEGQANEERNNELVEQLETALAELK